MILRFLTPPLRPPPPHPPPHPFYKSVLNLRLFRGISLIICGPQVELIMDNDSVSRSGSSSIINQSQSYLVFVSLLLLSLFLSSHPPPAPPLPLPASILDPDSSIQPQFRSWFHLLSTAGFDSNELIHSSSSSSSSSPAPFPPSLQSIDALI